MPDFSKQWPERTYKERKGGANGLVWEERFLLQLGLWVARGEWKRAQELVQRGSAAGRFEYPALRRFLAEVTRGVGEGGMRRVRDFLMEAFGDQPEWDPDIPKLLELTTTQGCTDQQKIEGSKELGHRAILLMRAGMALCLGFPELSALHLQKAELTEDEQNHCLNIVAVEFGILTATALRHKMPA